MLRLQTFGGLSVRGPQQGGAIGLGKRPLALLALTAVASSRGLRREKVIALLWPESDEEHGRNSLSQALTALRRELGVDAITGGAAEVRLDPAAITSDVEDYECAIKAGELERAVALYEGPFLDGIHIKGAHGFDEWAEEQRSRLHRLHATALERIAITAGERGDHSAAIGWWRRLAAADPMSARASLGLMSALAAIGERGAALQHYRVYETVLRDSVGAEPDDAVAQLAAALRQGNGVLRDALESVRRRNVIASDITIAAPDAASMGASPVPASRLAQREIDAPPSKTRHRRVPLHQLLAVAAIATVGILVAARARQESSATERRVTILPFRNLTGDSAVDALGYLAAQHVADGLQRSGLVEVADPTLNADVTGDLQDSAAEGDEATTDVGRVVGAGLLMTGTIGRDGDSLVVVTRLTDGGNGTLIAVSEPVRIATTAPVRDLEHVRQRALGMLAVRLDRTLDDLLPPGSSPPPTLAAYTEFLEGVQRFQRGEQQAARPFFERAYALDSSFVTPLVWQAWSAGLGDAGQARRLAARHELARRRDRLTPVDRQALEYLEANLRIDPPGRIAALQRASQLAPGSVWSYNLGNALNGFGRSDEAVAAFDQIDRQRGWLRYWPPFWRQFVRALHFVDHERELQVVREARAVLSARFPGGGQWAVGLMLDEANALAALGRLDELDRLIVEIEANDPTRVVGDVLSEIAMELRDRGDTTLSRHLLDRSLAWFTKLPEDDANRWATKADYALALYHAGRWSEARPIFDRLVAERPDMRVLALAGLSAAREGDRARAAEVVAQLAARPDTVPEWKMVVDSRLAYLARLAAVMGDRDRAVDYIEQLNARTGGRLSRHVLHQDFASLQDYPPFLRVTRARR